jgi:hypothetical protein
VGLITSVNKKRVSVHTFVWIFVIISVGSIFSLCNQLCYSSWVGLVSIFFKFVTDLIQSFNESVTHKEYLPVQHIRTKECNF